MKSATIKLEGNEAYNEKSKNKDASKGRRHREAEVDQKIIIIKVTFFVCPCVPTSAMAS